MQDQYAFFDLTYEHVNYSYEQVLCAFFDNFLYVNAYFLVSFRR